MTTPCRLRPDSDLLPLSRARLRASAHPLHYQLLHAYHHAACGCDDSRFARHEAVQQHQRGDRAPSKSMKEGLGE